MIIEPAHAGDIPFISRLHVQGITKGFLSFLGNSFLQRLYHTLLQMPGVIIFVARCEDGALAGFVAATVSTRGLYRRAIVKSGLKFFILLIVRCWNVLVLWKIIETLFYAISPKKSIMVKAEAAADSEAELLSIAVGASYRNQGVGAQLVADLDQWFIRQHIVSYKVVTANVDVAANTFYVHRGMTLSRQFYHHGNVMNEYCRCVST